MIHIGIDTVNLNGQHFSSSLKVGDEVKTGETLITFNIAAIEQAGYELITPVVVVNGDEDATLRMTTATSVTFGDELMVKSTNGSLQ